MNKEIIKKIKVNLVCMTEGCKNNGNIVNTITKDIYRGENIEEETELLFASFIGTGGDSADMCPDCGYVAMLQDDYKLEDVK